MDISSLGSAVQVGTVPTQQAAAVATSQTQAAANPASNPNLAAPVSQTDRASDASQAEPSAAKVQEALQKNQYQPDGSVTGHRILYGFHEPSHRGKGR